ncbi:MAG TPA: DUF5522 domain-containing protein [Silvibacterium sp.]|nr:DUF5522 domain-containing protein [Silvibacterium sp.]
MRLPEEAPSLIEGEDYYMDGAYLVFTEAYHRKRGYCCNSGCRHCPWRDLKPNQGREPMSEDPEKGHPRCG